MEEVLAPASTTTDTNSSHYEAIPQGEQGGDGRGKRQRIEEVDDQGLVPAAAFGPEIERILYAYAARQIRQARQRELGRDPAAVAKKEEERQQVYTELLPGQPVPPRQYRDVSDPLDPSAPPERIARPNNNLVAVSMQAVMQM